MSILARPKRVIIESPYRSNDAHSTEQHRKYLLHAIRDSIDRGEAPFASHLLIPEILNDDDIYERSVGIRCGYAWGDCAEMVAVYQDFGLSHGMRLAVDRYQSLRLPIEWRRLPSELVTSIKWIEVDWRRNIPQDSGRPGVRARER